MEVLLELASSSAANMYIKNIAQHVGALFFCDYDGVEVLISREQITSMFGRSSNTSREHLQALARSMHRGNLTKDRSTTSHSGFCFQLHKQNQSPKPEPSSAQHCMKLSALFAATIISPFVVLDNTIAYQEVKPFPQLEPITISEKAALRFKPQIATPGGCAPYAAVNDVGDTSIGLTENGTPRGVCELSILGSQVYTQSTRYSDVWAFMYAWYFPKDSEMYSRGNAHDWEYVVIWIDNPDMAEVKFLGVSASDSEVGVKKHTPLPAIVLDGTSIKVKSTHNTAVARGMDVWDQIGTFQDQIMWTQLTEPARVALNGAAFGAIQVPLNDADFLPNLGLAWPF